MIVSALSGGVYAGVSRLARPEVALISGLSVLSVSLRIVVRLLAAVFDSFVATFTLTFSVAVDDELATR